VGEARERRGTRLNERPTCGKSKELGTRLGTQLQPPFFSSFIHTCLWHTVCSHMCVVFCSHVCSQIQQTRRAFLRATVAHSTDFLKFHRQRRFEQGRLARTVRDFLAKQAKLALRDVSQHEKDRVAALKSSDIESYSKLLDAKKNERLKFLMETTDKYLEQITELLDAERGVATPKGGKKTDYYT